MESETLSAIVDYTFALTGVVISLWLIKRVDPRSRHMEPQPPARLGELLWTALALAVAAVAPNILVVALTPGMPEMHFWGKYFLLPSLLVLVSLVGFLKLRGIYPRLSNRILIGCGAGAAATGVLDLIRLTGFHLGWMPGNMPRMFGVLLLDRMAEGPTLGSDILGYFYHYWAGACFGLTLALIVGRAKWWHGLVWGLLIEVGMMTTAPMVVAMDTGYFGLKFKDGWQVLATSVPAHVAFGVVLGMLLDRYVAHEGSILLPTMKRVLPLDG